MSRIDQYHANLNQPATAMKVKDLSLLTHLVAYIKPHISLLVVGSLTMCMALALELWRPVIVKQVIDQGFSRQDASQVQELALLYFGTVIVSIIVVYLQHVTLKTFGQRIIFVLRQRIFATILRKSECDFAVLPIGDWVTRVTNDVEALRTLYADVMVKLAYNSFFILGILGFMYYLNVHLAMVMTCLVPIMGGLTFVYQKFSRKAFRQLRTQIASSNSSIQEFLNFIVIVKTYVGESIVEKIYKKVNDTFLAAGLFEVKTFAIFRPMVDALFFVAIIAIFTFTNLFDSVTDAGIVFAFIQYMDKFFQPMKEIAEKYNSLQSALAGAERLVPLLQESESIDITENHWRKQALPAELETIHSIEFDHVWFSYDGDETYALKDITLTIRGGDFIGIVGPSGGGKSTLMSLLTGLRRPSKGCIRINGYDMAQYDPTILRLLMSFVFQDVHLFKGTIGENLTMYDPSVSPKAMMDAARKVGLHDKIMNLAKGYDTPVGYLGSLLSAGQRQLLTFGRAVLKDSPVLLLDEATANIDSYTERQIQDSIEQVRGEKTIINVAHRLSTVSRANHIYMIQDGSIIEDGTFTDLMDKKDAFYQLWKYQQQ